MGTLKEKTVNNIEWEDSNAQSDVHEFDSCDDTDVINDYHVKEEDHGHIQQLRHSNPTAHKG